jgi:arylsulfatase A-like enzyme
MMTGRLPPRLGIGWIGSGSNGVFTSESGGGIPSNETTIAEVLSENGYATGMVGKW